MGMRNDKKDLADRRVYFTVRLGAISRKKQRQGKGVPVGFDLFIYLFFCLCSLFLLFVCVGDGMSGQSVRYFYLYNELVKTPEILILMKLEYN